MVEDKSLYEAFKKYERRIISSIYNLKILDSKLVKDALHEIFIVFMEEGKRIRYPNAIPKFIEFWILTGINRTLKGYFPEIKLLKEREISDFSEKVNRLVNEWDYNENNAKQFVILEETLKKKKSFISQVAVYHKSSDDNNRSYHYSEWIDMVREEFPEINEYDNPFIIDAIKFCFEKMKEIKGIKKNNVERNYKIMKDIFLSDENQNLVAEKYNLTGPMINQIKRRYLPALEKCLENKLGLEKN